MAAGAAAAREQGRGSGVGVRAGWREGGKIGTRPAEREGGMAREGDGESQALGKDV
jgi:hypothetical protein